MTSAQPARDPFDALGDRNRRAILELLTAGDRSVQELADQLPISRPAVSRHLRLLKAAGLVADEPRGTRRIYRLHDEGVEAVQRYLMQVWGDAAARFRLVARNTAPDALDLDNGAEPMMDPIHLEFHVECPVAHAFKIWTAEIGRWWPWDHSVSGERGLRVVLEGRLGGRIFERTPAGVEHEWGEITIWEPPDRLMYLWHMRWDRVDATEVEIRFVGVDAQTTRVQITHRGWERLGADGEQWRDRNRAGWSGLLPHFVAVASGG